MSLVAKVKAELEKLELDKRVAELSSTADKTFKAAVAGAADLAAKNQDKVADLLDKAEDFAVKNTNGKYNDNIKKVKAQVKTGVEKLAAKNTE